MRDIKIEPKIFWKRSKKTLRQNKAQEDVHERAPLIIEIILYNLSIIYLKEVVTYLYATMPNRIYNKRVNEIENEMFSNAALLKTKHLHMHMPRHTCVYIS